MSETGQEVLVRTGSQKTLDAIALVEASLGRISVYDVSGNCILEELEPYDALCDRFIGAVETNLNFSDVTNGSCLLEILTRSATC